MKIYMEKWSNIVKWVCIIFALIFVFNIPFLLSTMSEISKRIADISFLTYIVGAGIQAEMIHRYGKKKEEDK